MFLAILVDRGHAPPLQPEGESHILGGRDVNLPRRQEAGPAIRHGQNIEGLPQTCL